MSHEKLAASDHFKFSKIPETFRKSPFLKHNFVFFVGALGVAALNYLYYPVLGRLLEPVYFGEVQALMTIFLQAAIFLTILTYVTVHVTVNVDDQVERNSILLSLENVALKAGYGFLAIALLLTPWLKNFLNFHEVWPFIALIAALGLSIPLMFRMAFLRGRKLFAKASLTDGVGSLTKLIFAVILVGLGWKTFGAITGLALSQIVSLIFGVMWAEKAGFSGFGLTAKTLRLKQLKPQFAYALAVFVVSSGVIAILSTDIIAVKHYFSPEVAGQYAGMATVARIVYFLTAPFTAVLLSLVSVSQASKKSTLQLIGSISLIAALGGFATLFLAFFSDTVIEILVGQKYLAFSHLLPKMSAALLVLALANTLLMYQIALHRYWFSLLGPAAFILSLFLIYNHHQTISEIVNSVLTGACFLLVLSVAFTLIPKNKEDYAAG